MTPATGTFAAAAIGNMPAPGTPEARLYQDLDGPGLSPQTRDAFRQLAPADQHGMAAMVDRFGEQGRYSFLIYEPSEQKGMTALFGQLGEAGQAAFIALTPGEQRKEATLFAALGPAGKTAFVAQPVGTQTGMAAVFATLSTGQQASFYALKPDQQAQFARVYDAAGRVDFAGPAAPRAQAVSEVRDHLKSLLASGKLVKPGTDGQTVLSHLDQARTAPLTLPPGSNDPVYRQLLFNRLVSELDEPSRISQGPNGTCGATCVQREFCRHAPADYAGFILGLASTAGRGRMPDGTMVGRVSDSLVGHERTVAGGHYADSREQVDRLAQAALMNQVSPTGYSDAKDKNTVLGVGVASGMSGSGLRSLYASIRCQPTGLLVSDSAHQIVDGGGLLGVSKNSIVHAIGQQVARTPGSTVPVEIHWNHGGTGITGQNLHWVEVTRQTADRVYYENPHGNRFQVPTGKAVRDLPIDTANAKHYIEVNDDDGPPRRIYEDGAQSVSRAWFETSVEQGVVDPQLVAETQAAPGNRMDFSGILGSGRSGF